MSATPQAVQQSLGLQPVCRRPSYGSNVVFQIFALDAYFDEPLFSLIVLQYDRFH